MPKSKIIISLGLELSASQRQRLHKALHKTVWSQINKIKSSAGKKSKKKIEAEGMAVNVHADFSSTNPGLSELTAIWNDEKKKH